MHSEDSSIFAFQTIDVEGLLLNIFYDSGCGDLVVTKESVDKLLLKGHATQESSGPITLNGVRNQHSICEYGVYSITLPLESGTQAKMSGVCVLITSLYITFRKYPLSNVEKDFRN